MRRVAPLLLGSALLLAFVIAICWLRSATDSRALEGSPSLEEEPPTRSRTDVDSGERDPRQALDTPTTPAEKAIGLRVLAWPDGTPISGAEISIRGPGIEDNSTLTDPAGYALASVGAAEPEAPVYLRVTARGYTAEELHETYEHLTRAGTQTVMLRPDSGWIGRIEASPGIACADCEVVVVALDCAPIWHESLLPSGTDGAGTSRSGFVGFTREYRPLLVGRTDLEGYYHVPYEKDFARTRLAIWSPGHSGEPLYLLTSAPRMGRELPTVLPSGYPTVDVLVVDLEGAAVPGVGLTVAPIELRSPSRRLPPVVSMTAGAGGRAEIPILSESVVVRVSEQDWCLEDPASGFGSDPTIILSSESEQPARIVVGRCGLATWRVHDAADDQPVPHATIHVYHGIGSDQLGELATVGPDGSFDVQTRKRSLDSLRVSAAADGYQDGSWEVPLQRGEPVPERTIRLSREREEDLIDVAVTYGGLPAENAAVQAYLDDVSLLPRARCMGTDEAGRARLPAPGVEQEGLVKLLVSHQVAPNRWASAVEVFDSRADIAGGTVSLALEADPLHRVLYDNLPESMPIPRLELVIRKIGGVPYRYSGIDARRTEATPERVQSGEYETTLSIPADAEGSIRLLDPGGSALTGFSPVELPIPDSLRLRVPDAGAIEIDCSRVLPQSTEQFVALVPPQEGPILMLPADPGTVRFEEVYHGLYRVLLIEDPGQELGSRTQTFAELDHRSELTELILN